MVNVDRRLVQATIGELQTCNLFSIVRNSTLLSRAAQLSCSHERCGRLFHHRCLLEWLQVRGSRPVYYINRCMKAVTCLYIYTQVLCCGSLFHSLCCDAYKCSARAFNASQSDARSSRCFDTLFGQCPFCLNSISVKTAAL